MHSNNNMSLNKDLIELFFESSPERSENDSSSSSTSGDLTTSIHDKLFSAFSKITTADIFFSGMLQFWKPITIDGRRLLSTVGQPFTLGKHYDEGLHKYRLRSVEYVYNIDVNVNVNKKQQFHINEQVKPPIIINGAPAATAFLNRFPLSVYIDKGNTLSCYALECGLKYSLMLPVVCWPSQNSSSCIGVLECSLTSVWDRPTVIPEVVNMALEEVGLSIFQVQEHIPYQIISGLKPAKDEIDDALKIVCKSSDIALAQVWIPFEDENHVSFSSYLEGIPKKQILSLKLTGYIADSDFGFYCEPYYDFCDTFPLEMGEDFVDKTLEDYKPRFCDDVSKLSGDTLVPEFFDNDEVKRVAICLNSIDTGAFCYAFEFIWENDPDSDDVIFVEELLLTLKKLLPSFKLASGAQLGDELDFIEVEDSTATETKYLKIFQGKRLSPIPETEAAENLKGPGDELDVPDVENSTRSEKILQENILLPVPEALERGKKPMVENYIASSARKHKTARIPLSKKDIEHQYGNTMKEAAKNLNVSISTLKRKCKDFGILEWQGPNPVKRKVNNSSNQSRYINEEYDGAVQDPSAINRSENTLTIKAEYADDMIKFYLCISEATFITVEKEIGMRFKLTHGTYKLKYLDEDSEWILLASDQDMSVCMKSLRNLGRIVVRLRVLPSTQPISG